MAKLYPYPAKVRPCAWRKRPPECRRPDKDGAEREGRRRRREI